MRVRTPLLIIAPLFIAALACNLTGPAAAPAPDKTARELALTQAAIEMTQTALVQPKPAPPTALLPSPTEQTPTDTPAPPTPEPPGAIAGTLGYPSEGVPPMAVYAFQVDDPKYYSVTTQDRQQNFVIQGIPAGTYYVVAYLQANPDFAGGYSEFVLCGLSVNCHDHSLIPVTVRPGEITQGVQVTDWYAPPGAFPPHP